MKALFVIRSVAHVSYCESAIRHLCGKGHAVEVLFDREWSRAFSDRGVRALQATVSNVLCGWSLRRAGWWRRPLFACREVRSYASYLTRPEQSRFYLDRWTGYLPKRWRRLLTRPRVQRLLTSGLVQSLLRGFERLVPPDARITAELQRIRPDVLVATPVNLRFSEEVEYVKAARALGIPTVLPVLSWDNLTTKGLIHVAPDLTLVWNPAQRDEAVSVHGIPAEKTLITGSPFFDKWFEPARSPVPREAFVRAIGLEPHRPYVLYLGSSKNIARDESWLVRELAEALRASPCPRLREAAIVVRPHPANTNIYEALPPDVAIVWPRQGALPDTADLLEDFRHSLQYAVATVGLNTSGMIDAVINDKPCITIMPPRYKKTQQQAVHFRHLLEADVLKKTTTAAECVAALERLAAGPEDPRRANRQRFVRDFVRPRGPERSAGELAGEAIEMMARGMSPREIDEALRRPEPRRRAA